MIFTEMFIISYDLSWFSSLKNSHIVLLVQVIVHIYDVIKIMTSSKNIFLLDFFRLFLILLNYLMLFGDCDNIYGCF